MKRAWKAFGVICFWGALIALRFYLQTEKRTRIFLVANNKVLVVRPWLGNGKWSLPGGGLHKDELAENGLLRELREETSLQLRRKDIKRIDNYWYRQNWLKFEYTLFLGRVSEPMKISRQPLEIIDCAWLPVGEVSSRICNDDVRTGLEAWRQQI